MKLSKNSTGRLEKTLTLVVLLSALTGCVDSIRVDNRPVLGPPPDELVQDCADPTQLPDRSLRQFEVEDFWLRDREALVQCGLEKESLITFYQRRDSALSE